MAASLFDKVTLAKPIEVFELTRQYNEDKHPNKVNLSVGAYRDDEGRPWVLPVVRTVEAQMVADQSLNHEYLPVSGLPSFRSACIKLLLGIDSKPLLDCRVDSVQSLGGTGALRIGFEFLRKIIGLDTIYVSKPTWGNHIGVAKATGFTNICEYRYWDEQTRSINFEGMLEDFEKAPRGAVIVIHMCCHNPTGTDPTPDQWHQIAEVIRAKELFPFFDCAYQGFGTGNLDQDAYGARYFANNGFEMFAAQSFSKNFGLYNERVGNLLFISNNSDSTTYMRSQMEIIVRTTYSNPSNHGGRIVATILNNPALNAEWKEHVRAMAERIKLMRELLRQKLRALGTPGNWDHIVQQQGMFSYTGLNPRQCEKLIQEYHVYVMRDGRINMCGLTAKNIDYASQSMHEVLEKIPDEPRL